MLSSAKLDGAVTGQPEYILVPRIPTKAMLDAGWYEAHDEDAAGVWREMIRAWEETRTQDHEQGAET
jgi:hypothetical protein